MRADKIDGLKGQISFVADEKKFEAMGAELQFDNQNGVLLEWSGQNFWQKELTDVTGRFYWRVWVPSLAITNHVNDGGGYHFKAQGSEMYYSQVEVALDIMDCRSFEIPVPLLSNYLSVNAPSWNQPVFGVLDYHWKSFRTELGHVPSLGASVILRIEAEARTEVSTGGWLEMRPSLQVTYEEEQSIASAAAHASQLRRFMELLMGTQNPEALVNFDLGYDRLYYRKAVPSGGVTKGLTVIALPEDLCRDSLPSMVESWCRDVGQRRGSDHLLRLLALKGAPWDIRFFLVFTALGYINNDRSAQSHRKKRPEVEHLRDMIDRWQVLMPGVGYSQIEKYLERLANTRHDIAHLSRTGAEVLTEENDIKRAYNQLHCLARALLFEQLGLPTAVAAVYVHKFADYIQRHFGEVPMSLRM